MMKTFKAAACVGIPLALAACAQSGQLQQQSLQGAFNAVGAMMGNKPANAVPGGTSSTGRPEGSASGAAADPQLGRMVQINGVNVMIDGPRPTDPRWAGKPLRETVLYKFFEKHPASRPGEYFPRVGIRIDDYSESLARDDQSKYLLQMNPSMHPNVARPPECLKFSAVIWMSEKQSQKVDNVVLCNADIHTGEQFLSRGALQNYASYVTAPFSISSEQVRTMGPRVPLHLLPQDTSEDTTMYWTGQHLFSALFVQTGYRGPLDGDQRMWFVNLSKK